MTIDDMKTDPNGTTFGQNRVQLRRRKETANTRHLANAGNGQTPSILQNANHFLIRAISQSMRIQLTRITKLKINSNRNAYTVQINDPTGRTTNVTERAKKFSESWARMRGQVNW